MGWIGCAILAGMCTAPLASAKDAKPAASLDEKGLTLRSPGDEVTFELGGRFHTNLGSGGSRDLTNEFPDAARIRRFWIEPTIKLGPDLTFNLQYDPSSRLEAVNNLLLSWKAGPFTLTGGNFKEPLSLEQMMSNNDITFVERSLADAFAPSRNTGAAIGVHGERWTLAAGVFGGNVNSSVDRGGLAGTARATFAPILTESAVLHLGIAGSRRVLDRRGPDLSFDTQPESFLFRPSLVETDAIDGARAINRLGLEAALAAGPFRIQGEWIETRVERAGGLGSPGTDLRFRGGYVYGAWVLNGKGPRYTLSSDVATEAGVFKRVEPESGQRLSRGGIGVFELAARYSVIDLDSRDVRGGRERNATAGLNWYPEPYLRVSTNYIRAWADASPASGRDTIADIGEMRLQIAF